MIATLILRVKMLRTNAAAFLVAFSATVLSGNKLAHQHSKIGPDAQTMDVSDVPLSV